MQGKAGCIYVGLSQGGLDNLPLWLYHCLCVRLPVSSALGHTDKGLLSVRASVCVRVCRPASLLLVWLPACAMANSLQLGRRLRQAGK